MPGLFSPWALGDFSFRNRIVLSPMCQYLASEDGLVQDWHVVHYGSRAVGGVSLVLLEATAVDPRGRLSSRDLGIWDDRHLPGLIRLVEVIHQGGALAGVQLAHAGRKAFDPAGLLAPSPLPFEAGGAVPHELTGPETAAAVASFAAAARRAHAAGFDVIEMHGAHGYLFHEFLSPATNRRTDTYAPDLTTGGRFAREVLTVIREAVPDRLLFLRLSGEEYLSGGYTPADLTGMARRFRELGVDLFDVSAGGDSPERPSTLVPYPGYQVTLAAGVREKTGAPTMAVGRLEDPFLAEYVLERSHADLVAIGRGLLRDPYWPLRAAQALGVPVPAPEAYRRGF